METRNVLESVKVRINDNKKMVITNCNGAFHTPLFWDGANEAVLTRSMNAHKLIGYICDQVYGEDMFHGYATGFTFKKIFNIFATYYDLKLKERVNKLDDILLLEFEISDEGTDDCGDNQWSEKINIFEGSGKYLFSLNRDCDIVYDANVHDYNS